jgi:Spy/CpxP family protein refolding chaperone
MAAWLVAAAMVWGQSALAQGPGQRPGFSPGRAAERLAERLNLTAEQKATVQSYLEDQRSQMQVLRNDTALTREQRAQRMREITQQTRDKIQSILTVEQRQRAEDLRNQARQRIQERAQEQFDRTARLLDLTPEQKTQMQSLLENQRTQLQALRDNTSLTQEQRREQARAIGEQTRSNIRSLLNPTQQQKLDDLRASRRGGFGRGPRRGGPRGRGGPGGFRTQGMAL